MATSARYRALLSGPGDDAEADAIEELVAAGRRHRRPVARATRPDGHGQRRRGRSCSVAPVMGLGAGAGRGMGGGGGGGRRRWGRAGAGALQISPELIAAVEALPPGRRQARRRRRRGSEQARDLPVAPLPPPVPQAGARSGSGSSWPTRSSSSRAPCWCSAGCKSGVLEGSEKVLFAASAFFFAHRHRRLAAHVDLHALHGPHRGAAALRAAHPDLLAPPAARARLLRPRDGGSDHDPHDHRRRGVLATCCRPGIIQALVSLMSFVGVLVVLAILSWQLTLGGHGHPAAVDHRDGLVPARVVARVHAGARRDLHGERRVPGEHLGRPRRAGVRARGREHRLVPQHHRRVPQRPGHAPSRSSRSTSRSSCSCRPARDAIVFGYGGSLVHDGVITSATVLTFVLFLDQFFAPIQQLSQVFDQWQSAPGVDDEDQRAHAHRGVDARPRAPRRARPGRAARSSSTTCTSATRTPASRSCTASTSRSSRARRWRSSARPARASRRSSSSSPASTTSPAVRSSIDGVPITDLDLRAYRRRLGYVPQEPFLFSGTIRDNIAYGRPDATDAEVEQAARAVGAHEFVAELPGGYLHPVTERGRSMSAGQRQLICLARGAARRPRRSCCSTRPPPTSTSAPRRGCSGRWAWSPAVAPRC